MSARTPVVIGAAVAVTIALAIGWFGYYQRAQSDSEPVSEGSVAAPQPDERLAISSGAAAQAQGAKPPRLEDAAPPTYTAAWMNEAPNPLSVTITPGAREQRTEITPGGGEINITLESGDRVTLRVLDGAVAQNVELRLQSVAGLAGSPFTDTIAAVVVSAESGVLLRPATLTIERRRRRDAQPLAGFAAMRRRATTRSRRYDFAKA